MELGSLKLTPRRKQILNDLGINNVEELLTYYPFRYEENITKPFNEWQIGDTLVFEGELIKYPSTFRYFKRAITRFSVLYDDEEINVTIFNRPWMKGLKLNEKITIKGKYDGKNKFTALNYSLHDVQEELGIKAIYSLKDGMRQNDITKMVKLALKIYPFIDEMPIAFRQKHQLIDYQTAINEIHFPSSKENLKKAITRLKYEEFLRFYLTLGYLKQNNSNTKKAKQVDRNKINELISSLPYPLTSDQNKCVDDILNDLSKNYTVTRLIQGDVGSGKTIVAAIALYATTLSGYQAAMLAPTEILAKQHYEFLKSLLPDINIEILYSDMDNAKLAKEAISSGKAQIIIGTHALFSDDVKYHDLALVIADEQQRFGVKQRRKLKDKGQDVDVLLMSATPIPRTLASSIYGDMEISTIESMPSGRKGCDTNLIKANSIVSIMDEIKETLASGRQAYIICSAIEPSESIKVKDANTLYESLIEVMKPYRLGLLHGKMDQSLKDETMEKFVNHEINILISTTVIEVGVNVPNATMMIIYDADRFGLSQLHQLRGRVQRSSYKGKCYLLTASKDLDSLKRLNTLVESNDGFYIANEDLKLRGPGDILGTRQSGLPPFVLGDLINDVNFIEAAKIDAKELVDNLSLNDNADYYAKVCALASANNID